MTESNEAFVICQIGDEGSAIRKRADELYNYIIQPVLNDFELEGRRSDKLATPGQVTSQIVKALVSASVVIADLTGRNPNVYYELAVAHSFARPVVIFVDNPSSLSFDTKDERVIPIGDEGQIGVSQAEDAKKRLRETLKVVLFEGYKPSSLVTEVAGSQSLADLAPEDPEAAGLSVIKERVDQVFAEVRRLGRSAKGEGDIYREDRMQLLHFLELLAGEGRTSPTELRGLVSPMTSNQFDSMIEQLALRLEQTPGRASQGSWGVRSSEASWGGAPQPDGGWGTPSTSRTSGEWGTAPPPQPVAENDDDGGF